MASWSGPCAPPKWRLGPTLANNGCITKNCDRSMLGCGDRQGLLSRTNAEARAEQLLTWEVPTTKMMLKTMVNAAEEHDNMAHHA